MTGDNLMFTVVRDSERLEVEEGEVKRIRWILKSLRFSHMISQTIPSGTFDPTFDQKHNPLTG